MGSADEQLVVTLHEGATASSVPASDRFGASATEFGTGAGDSCADSAAAFEQHSDSHSQTVVARDSLVTAASSTQEANPSTLPGECSETVEASPVAELQRREASHQSAGLFDF